MNLVHIFKRISQVTLVFMAVCLLGICGNDEVKAATSSTYYETIDGVKWKATVNTDGSVFVQPNSKSEISGNVTVPDTVSGYTVTGIYNNAFSKCTSLTGITLPETITVIRTCAFSGCTNLTQVNIPSGVSEIGQEVFEKCGFTEFTIPSNIKTLGWEAFLGCASLSNLTIESGVETIGKEAFGQCTSLTSVTIPDSITSVGGAVFYGCSNLVQINVDADNTNYTSIDGVLFDKTGKTLVCYPYGQSTTYQIPEGVERIESYAFYKTKITNITVPSTLTSIGAYAFAYSKKIESFSISSNLTEIEKYAFSGSNLSSVTVEGNIGKIGDYAFSGNDYLTEFNISGMVGSIGNYAFNSCSDLQEAPIKEGLTSIGEAAFYFCWDLESINIPASVSYIGDLAFYTCHIQNITVAAENENYCAIDNVLFDKDKTELILCSGSKTGAYVVPDGATVIDVAAFFDCDGLTSVTLPEGLDSIGSMAFYGCTSMTDISIPESVTCIESGALENCSSLTNVAIPEGITAIEGSTFSNCTSLVDITLPDSLTSIGSYTFDRCSSLASIRIPEGVTTIDSDAFNGCINLASIVIPESLYIMGYHPFGDSTDMNIETIYYTGNQSGWNSLGIEEDSPLANCPNIYFIAPRIEREPVDLQYTWDDLEAAPITVDALPGEDIDGNEIGTLSYQWYSNTDSTFEDSTLIENATTSSYTPELLDGTTYYYCVVTNTYNGISGHAVTAYTEVTVGY